MPHHFTVWVTLSLFFMISHHCVLFFMSFFTVLQKVICYCFKIYKFVNPLFSAFFTQIAYMDHLDLPSYRGYQINYSLPRICHVRNADFNFVMVVDKNKLSLGNSFGRLLVCATLHLPILCSLVFLFAFFLLLNGTLYLHFVDVVVLNLKCFSHISIIFNTCCSSIV
jgi:hypothetical protein